MNTPDNILQACSILHSGGLVAIPTETVYGLAADARNPDAIAKIFAAKGRPSTNPLIVHIADIESLGDWAVSVPAIVLDLAKRFWPGPLTLILKKRPDVLDIITGGQDTIGIRIPNHPLTLDLLKQFQGGLAAPSANRFGSISPTTADAVQEELGDAVDLILDGGQCWIGLESTILDLTGNHPTILRPGMINAAQIESVLQQSLGSASKLSPRVSGSCASHYAPRTQTQLVSEADWLAIINNPLKEVGGIGFAGFSDNPNVIVLPNNPAEYAHSIYDSLRRLDNSKLQKIYIQIPPQSPEWLAIQDRLQRAAF